MLPLQGGGGGPLPPGVRPPAAPPPGGDAPPAGGGGGAPTSGGAPPGSTSPPAPTPPPAPVLPPGSIEAILGAGGISGTNTDAGIRATFEQAMRQLFPRGFSGQFRQFLEGTVLPQFMQQFLLAPLSGAGNAPTDFGEFMSSGKALFQAPKEFASNFLN